MNSTAFARSALETLFALFLSALKMIPANSSERDWSV